MSINALHQIAELKHEIRMLNADIRKYEREVLGYLDYIEYLKEQYCNPQDNINKYIHKVKKVNEFLEVLKKDRWFLKAELVMWKQGHEYE